MKLAPVASPVRRVSYWCPDPGNAETALSGLPGAGRAALGEMEAWLRPGTTILARAASASTDPDRAVRPSNTAHCSFSGRS